MCILVVSESDENRLVIEEVLKENGIINIVSFAYVDDAIIYLHVDQPKENLESLDLIILDIALSEINGKFAFEIIHSHVGYRDIPILLVIDYLESEKIKEALSIGVVDFIAKPLKQIELLARVKFSLALKKEIDERKARETELLDMIQKMKIINQQLQQISFFDGLTGIANRRHFDEFLLKEWSRASRDQTFLVIMVLDIDFFKGYNDIYGHLEGDICLKLIATILESAVKRPTDLAARYGGEEFVMVLPSTDLIGGKKVAERIRKGVDRLRVPHSGSLISKFVTVSIGLSAMVPSGDNPDILLSEADQALYAAKRAGRNKVMCYMKA